MRDDITCKVCRYMIIHNVYEDTTLGNHSSKILDDALTDKEHQILQEALEYRDGIRDIQGRKIEKGGDR